uniref:Uncharacterized protein n=1 Tax=Arabidopsis thaliana TaxID=3702 RepID=Q570R1_ARATH|nr:hypothetical protein [Arabidopsis thaliana]
MFLNSLIGVPSTVKMILCGFQRIV